MHNNANILAIALLLVILCTVLDNANIVKAQINITVSIPVEKYVLDELNIPNIRVEVILSGEHEPHLTEFEQHLIKYVKNTDIFVPVWHFPFEVRLAQKLKELNKIVVQESEYRLTLLRYPQNPTIINTHGWWLYPDNVREIARAICEKIIQLDPTLAHIVQSRLSYFNIEIERVKQMLRTLGTELRAYVARGRILIVCAAPALQYLLHAMNVSCVVIQEGRLTPDIVQLVTRFNGKLLVLLANFQVDSDVDRYFRELIKSKGGTLLYVPVLGLTRLNFTYSQFLLVQASRVVEAARVLAMYTLEKTGEVKSSRENMTLVYLVYVLSVLLAISVILNLSFLKRRRVSFLK